MRSIEPDRNGDLDRPTDRRPQSGLGDGTYDARNGASPLAEEFAHRALAHTITDLRTKQGDLDPAKVASAIGLTVPQLAGCLELSEAELRKSPPDEDVELRLEPFAMVVAIVRDAYGGDAARVKTWLRTPRPELGGRSPTEALCVPAGVQTVVHFVLGAWLGNAD